MRGACAEWEFYLHRLSIMHLSVLIAEKSFSVVRKLQLSLHTFGESAALIAIRIDQVSSQIIAGFKLLALGNLRRTLWIGRLPTVPDITTNISVLSLYILTTGSRVLKITIPGLPHAGLPTSGVFNFTRFSISVDVFPLSSRPLLRV